MIIFKVPEETFHVPRRTNSPERAVNTPASPNESEAPAGLSIASSDWAVFESCANELSPGEKIQRPTSCGAGSSTPTAVFAPGVVAQAAANTMSGANIAWDFTGASYEQGRSVAATKIKTKIFRVKITRQVAPPHGDALI